jgi:hypothetical protein
MSEQIDNATAKLLLKLAFVLERGTDVQKAFGDELMAYREVWRAEGQREGREALIAKVRALPSPVRRRSPVMNLFACDWCGEDWAIRSEHPANDCLWALASPVASETTEAG